MNKLLAIAWFLEGNEYLLDNRFYAFFLRCVLHLKDKKKKSLTGILVYKIL